MESYVVKKGKHYFKGDKIQLAFLQYFVLATCLTLGLVYESWWWVLGGIVSFIGFWAFLDSAIRMESVRVYFMPNCKYQLLENYDQVNKLFGFSEGFHHWNSARIGWRCVDGENIELLAYCYINGQRIIKPMITCKPGTWVFCNIQSKPSKYVLKALSPNNQSITISVDKGKKWSIYTFFKLFIYKLFPYFGGKIAAPHDMEIRMIKLTFES